LKLQFQRLKRVVTRDKDEPWISEVEDLRVWHYDEVHLAQIELNDHFAIRAFDTKPGDGLTVLLQSVSLLKNIMDFLVQEHEVLSFLQIRLETAV
jgi:hypothetical protein